MWHTFFVMSGIEDQVVFFLQKQVRLLNIEVPHELFYPTRKLAHFDHGAKTIVTRALFPGYMFLKADDTSYFRKMMRVSTKYLTMLRDADLSFETMKQNEIDAILRLLNDWGEIDFSFGLVESDRVRITSGPLKNYCGKILKINKRECKAKIQLNFMGNAIFTYVGFNALEKIEEKELADVRDFYFERC